MHPKDLSIKDYTYLLPQEAIANFPLPERDASKLLIYQNGRLSEDVFRNIADYIPPHSLLVFNNTRVIEARLLFQKPTGGVVEIFCLSPHERYPDITTAMLQQGKVWWQCLVGGVSKWKPGQVLEKKIHLNQEETRLQAVYIEKRADHFIIEISWLPATPGFAEVLHHAGVMPLPPYIKRAVVKTDTERYQTIYARFDGSVAAPTAGLHFTEAIFKKLALKNIQKDFVTLHVGAATFKPVKSETMQDHEMHAELMHVSKATIENILQNPDQNIIAVGTTSFRSIESLYWLGVKAALDKKQASGFRVDQWDAYELAKHLLPVRDSLGALIEWMNKNKRENILSATRLLVAPGYKPKIVKALITNFHQPQSTLLLLVAALIGEDWKRLYAQAMENKFRFLSYGDGSLLWY